MNRKECLNKATAYVTGQREEDYGSPEDNFSTIAKLWSSYLGVNVCAIDVAAMMALLKIGRISSSLSSNGVPTDDCWVDLAGYAACGAELCGRTSEVIFEIEKEQTSSKLQNALTEDDSE